MYISYLNTIFIKYRENVYEDFIYIINNNKKNVNFQTDIIYNKVNQYLKKLHALFLIYTINFN